METPCRYASVNPKGLRRLQATAALFAVRDVKTTAAVESIAAIAVPSALRCSGCEDTAPLQSIVAIGIPPALPFGM
jgi:hypothetical protein